jgi:citrate synthase
VSDTASPTSGTATGESSLSVRDNRTGREYDIPVADGVIRGSDLATIKTADDEPGLALYDPGFVNTASCRSAITYIDGDKGILEYRGYPIEQLAGSASYLEVAYLLIHGELPDKAQYESFVHENVKTFMQGFRYDAHPMGMMLASVGALSTFYPESRSIEDPDNRHMQTVRMIAKMPTLGAWAFRHAQGKPYVYPDNDLSYAANFLAMLFKMSEPQYAADERLVKALEVLFILHADHEQNCSTNAVRSVGSSQVDPYSAVAAGIAALYGPLHGGANEAVLRMLRKIGSVDDVADYIDCVKTGKERLMGFGHRVYKNYDPRAKIIKQACDDVFDVTGVNPLLKIALELEKIALEDEYFVSRKLYPNVDFYSGLIYEALSFPPEMFTVLFAIPRTSGWLAQWLELVGDDEQKIARPKQVYTGARTRDYVSADQRWS